MATTFALPTSPSLRHHLQRLLAAWQRRARDRRERVEFMQLDACSLRDLGLCRSEYDSCLSEAYGEANRTRRRLGSL